MTQPVAALRRPGAYIRGVRGIAAEDGQPTPGAVRFWARITTDMLPNVAALGHWTVISVLPDPHYAGVSLVEVADPDAPAEAAGLICCPAFRSQEATDHRRWRRHAPAQVVGIIDYGIPDRP